MIFPFLSGGFLEFAIFKIYILIILYKCNDSNSITGYNLAFFCYYLLIVVDIY
jgi:hypothetical protein